MSNAQHSTTGKTVSPPLRVEALRSVSLAAHAACALINWLDDSVHAHAGDGADEVTLPISNTVGFLGSRELRLVVDRPGPFTVTCRDREVLRAALALGKAGLLDDLLADIKLDREGEELFDFAFPHTELGPMVWQMWRACERILDRASWLEVTS